MKLGITYELNTRMKFTTLAPKRNCGCMGDFITKHIKCITLITVTSLTPTQFHGRPPEALDSCNH